MVYYVEHAMLLLYLTMMARNNIIFIPRLMLFMMSLFILPHHLYKITAFDIIRSQRAHSSHCFQKVYFIIVQKTNLPLFLV